eukprot:Gb_01131 [translate_table: standard]
MLCPAENQVAGHYAEGGHLGPLVDKAGRFYKPLQDNERGQNEIDFYQKFWADQNIPCRVQDFFPMFYGTTLLEASDGSGQHEHAIIEDLTCDFHHPSVIDIKIGSRTWYPEASEEYINKCLEKDRQTTSLLVGFRISGMQVYDASTKSTWKAKKKWCKHLDTEGVSMALKRFVSLNPSSDTDPDGSLAPVIYDGSGCILQQLQELKAWFEEQTHFRFHSSSILLIYEGDPLATDEIAHSIDFTKYKISVKLIDFSHVLDGQNIIDHNFLGGLCSLIKFLSQIVPTPAPDHT